jgi:hydroxyacylglutathione hydrolase
MILLEDYDPKLKNWWWIEGTDISSNMYLFDDGKVLVDTGNFEGLASQIDEEFDVSKIEKILLTHCHFDHVGGLTELLYFCNPEILAHRNGLPLIHFEQFSFVQLMEKAGRSNKVVPLRGGERIQAGTFDLEIVHIPGHTIDHIAIYEHTTQTMLTGDMVFPSTTEINTLSAPDPKIGDLDQILTSLKRLLKYEVKNLLPGHGVPVFEAGGEHIKKSLYESIKDIDKMEDKAWIEVAQALSDHGRLEEAVACYDALLRMAPTHIEARLYKALASTEMGKFEEAMEYLDLVLKRVPDLQEALIGKGFALLGMGKVEEALLIPGFAEKLARLQK